MEPRLPTSFWIDALVRRVEIGGASAFIIQKGDPERGDVLVKVAKLDGTARLYAPSMDLDGNRIFLDLIVQGVGPDEADVDQYVLRARGRDTDVWVVEIEDRDGRHFLTESVKLD
ncbi:MAG: DUF1491 family protein [Pseudomonadota bacterium]